MAIPNGRETVLPAVGTDPQSVRQRVEAMEKLLERLFVIPGINRPVGLDVILDLVPGRRRHRRRRARRLHRLGSKNLGMSKWQMSRMAGNVGIDWLLGLISRAGHRRHPRFLLPLQHAQPAG